MRTLSDGYILNEQDFKATIKEYYDFKREFGDCIIIVGHKEFRDILFFKSYIEECLSKRQYYWCCLVSVE